MISYRLSSPFLLPFWPPTAVDGMKNLLNCQLYAVKTGLCIAVAQRSLPKVPFSSVQLQEALGLGEQTSRDHHLLNEANIKSWW